MAAVLIQPAALEDSETLSQIAQAAKRYWGYPERWLELWQAELTISADYISTNRVFKARIGGVPAGFYSLTISPAEVEIDHLWVAPAFMGQGIGRRLWEHAAGQAAGQGAQRLVVLADPHAEGFYRRMGMSPAGEQIYTLDGQPRLLPRLEFVLSR